MKIPKKFLLLFVIILIIGVGRNIYYAYRLSGYLDDDCATIGLMADDILHGRFNTFFYGQDYNAALDSIWLAPFIYLFGLKPFIVLLGTITQYITYIFTLYILGSFIKNRYVGILAFAYCAIAPYPLLHSSVFPYGYHINIIILGNLILILTLLIDKKANNIWMWILLGLCAGLGFWDHYIILYYLAPSALFLLIKKTTKRFKYYFVAGIAFFIGSLPFWKYNFQSGFPSFTSKYSKVYIYEESSNVHFMTALKKLFGYHISGLMGAGRINISAFIIWGIFLFAFIVFCVKLNRKRFLLILFLCSFLGFSLSHEYFIMENKYYFFLPLYTLISVCFGYFINWVYYKKGYIGIGLCLFVLLFNFSDFALSRNQRKPDKKDIEIYNYRNTAYKGLIEFLYTNKINAVISDYITAQGINFMTNKKVTSSEFRNGRIPIDELAQAGDRLALVDHLGELPYADFLSPFLDKICKDYKKTQLFDYTVLYDFNKYEYYGRSIDSTGWKVYTNYNEKDALNGIDRNLDKFWSSEDDKKPGMYYEIDLGRIYKIYRLIVINIMPHLDNIPAGYEIEVSNDRFKWTLVNKGLDPQPLFWSGPRLYWDYKNGRWEVIFKPIEARYIRIKNTEDGQWAWMINELYIYEYSGEKNYRLKDYVKKARKVYGWLVKNDKKRGQSPFLKKKGDCPLFLYADFWLSAKIKKWSKEKIGSLRVTNECYPRRDHTSRFLEINENTAVIVDKGNNEEVEKVFEEFELAVDKIDFGDYICFKFNNLSEWQRYFFRNQKCLYWTGISIAKINLYIYNYILTSYGIELEKKGDLKGASYYYKKAVSVFPRNNVTLERLVRAYKSQGLFKEAERQLYKLRHLCYPEIFKRVVFKNGIIFQGYSLFQYRDRLYINYYWYLPRKMPKGISVFVYFIKNGKIVFQNDHDFLRHFVQPIFTLDGMIYVEKEYIKIPEDAESGLYEMQLGLYKPDTGVRVGIKGARKSRSSIGNVNIEKL